MEKRATKGKPELVVLFQIYPPLFGPLEAVNTGNLIGVIPLHLK
jgi:hypothetical protein